MGLPSEWRRLPSAQNLQIGPRRQFLLAVPSCALGPQKAASRLTGLEPYSSSAENAKVGRPISAVLDSMGKRLSL